MPGIWGWSRINEDEYRANINGLNTFFGAVLGFVIADITTRDPLHFAQVLLITSAVVVGILYVSASPRRWLYAVFNLLVIWGLSRIVPPAAGDVQRLQITLAVWNLMAVGVEALWALQQRLDARRLPPAAD